MRGADPRPLPLRLDGFQPVTGVGAKQEMEMLGHQAVAVKIAGIATLSLRRGDEECLAIVGIVKDIGPVVPPIPDMNDQPPAVSSVEAAPF